MNREGKVLDVIVGKKDGTDTALFDTFITTNTYYSRNRIIKTSFAKTLSDREILILNRLRLDSLVFIGLEETGRISDRVAIMRKPPNTEDRLLFLPLNDRKNESLFSTYINAFEEELSRFRENRKQNRDEKRAILIGCGQIPDREISFYLNELSSLLLTLGIKTADSLWQKRIPDTSFLVGRGKLQEIGFEAEFHNADLVVFFNSLSPMQKKNIEDTLGLQVLDRNQVILEIFARRARSNEGKIQVELASLKYQLPRLTEKDTGLSRLVGGFKTKGPGETKLEMMKRQTRERIALLSKKVQEIRRRREFTRQKRRASEIPIVAIVGYTNAGKSTLLNKLTNSTVYTEDMPFATLDPTVRRFTFDDGFSILLSDTVGFIKDLPYELKEAFMATFEEIRGADLILHLADASSEDVERQIEAVEEILVELEVDHIPRILVFNKIDMLKEAIIPGIKRSDGIYISASTGEGLSELLNKMRRFLILSN